MEKKTLSISSPFRDMQPWKNPLKFQREGDTHTLYGSFSCLLVTIAGGVVRRKSRIYFGTLGKKTMTMKRPRLKVFFRRRKSNFQLWRRWQWRKLILITKITLYLDSSSSSSSVYLCKIWYFTLSLLASVSRKPNAMKINLFRAKQQLRLYSYDTGRCIWVFSSCIFAMTYYWTWSIAYCPS